jgi:hypothetical protein
VRDFITPKYRPMNPQEDGQKPGIMSVKAFVDGEAPAGRMTPLDVAAAIERLAAAGSTRQTVNLEVLTPVGTEPNRELAPTLTDIRMMSWLGQYYAEKIRGAVDLYRSEKTSAPADRDSARTHLSASADAWREYARLWSSQYLPQTLTRMGTTPVDIQAIQAFVDKDIEAAR